MTHVSEEIMTHVSEEIVTHVSETPDGVAIDLYAAADHLTVHFDSYLNRNRNLAPVS